MSVINATTFRNLVLEKFPDATDDEISYILWNHTGYPAFFQGDPVTACRSQLTALFTLGGDDEFADPVIKMVHLEKRRPMPFPRRQLFTSMSR